MRDLRISQEVSYPPITLSTESSALDEGEKEEVCPNSEGPLGLHVYVRRAGRRGRKGRTRQRVHCLPSLATTMLIHTRGEVGWIHCNGGRHRHVSPPNQTKGVPTRPVFASPQNFPFLPPPPSGEKGAMSVSQQNMIGRGPRTSLMGCLDLRGSETRTLFLPHSYRMTGESRTLLDELLSGTETQARQCLSSKGVM